MVDELLEIGLRPVFAVLRYLFWEVLFEVAGWCVGWTFFRIISLGTWPRQGILDQDRAGLWTALAVEVTGLILMLAAGFSLASWM